MKRFRPLLPYVQTLLIIMGMTAAITLVRDLFTLANFITFYLLVILILALRYGTGPALVAALVSFVSINYFLVKPFYTLFVAEPHDFIDLWIFLLVAAISGQLGARIKQISEEAQQRARDQEILYHLTEAFNQLTTETGVFEVLIRVVRVDLNAVDAVVLSEKPSSQAPAETVYTLPLHSAERMYGVLQARFQMPLADSRLDLLHTCVSQAALALERIDLTIRANKSQQFEDADKLKTAILHAVSHDLRTPITIIKSSTRNLRHLGQRLSPEDENSIIETIENEVDHLNHLIGDLLDMSRLQAGALSLNISQNSLEEIAEDVAARMWDLTRQERMTLVFDETLPLVECDYALIRQAVTNLVDNALRYEPPDQQICLEASAHDHLCRLRIVNHGPSIAPEMKERLMEPFYHGPDGHIGLGLPIARGIVEAHRGQLSIEDTPGGGATFVIDLPNAQGESNESENSGCG